MFAFFLNIFNFVLRWGTCLFGLNIKGPNEMMMKILFLRPVSGTCMQYNSSCTEHVTECV